MFLGIEVGGTKLQLGVGAAETAELAALRRADIQPADGAQGILNQIRQLAPPLIAEYGVRAIGIGFGGPVDVAAGCTIKSHHVAGWDDFPLVDWCRREFHLPASLANDSDMAGLGEARFGAGRDNRVVFYTNCGSGIGGALCIDGRVYAGGVGIAAELGHLRPGPAADRPGETVESHSSGWAIARTVQADRALAVELQRQFNCPVEKLTAKHAAIAAEAGNQKAVDIFLRATETYGWAIAQMITLLAPQIVVVGGGVALAGRQIFFNPLKRQIERYVFPPLLETFRLEPAKLGEEVVVCGTLALARAMAEAGNTSSLFIP